MSHLRIRVERADLPTPDIAIVNHPQGGLVIIADHRVPDAVIASTVEVVERRADLHPERLNPVHYLPGGQTLTERAKATLFAMADLPTLQFVTVLV